MNSNACVFLDRDGVLNADRVDYVYSLDRFHILPGVPEALAMLKEAGFKLVVITNQSGIAKGIYTREDMHRCHAYFQEQTGHLIDAFYYSPWHPSFSESLSRKPGTLMFQKAIARFAIDPGRSWMVGDRQRDTEPAKSLGMRTIQVGEVEAPFADFRADDLLAAARLILSW
jgi:D-glycero-D-manno-heptose 1,7-bisphosphate phosphatase